MKHIQRKISLEQFKSRMPSIIPAFYDNGKYYEFDGKTSINGNEKMTQYTNYGLVPYGVKWDRGKYKFNVDNDGIEHYISYNTISTWFHFIEFYIELLKKHGCLTDNYESAEEYGNYENNLKYNDYDYINFDKKIIEICGEPINKTLYEQAKETYEFMISNYFPRFNIEEKLQKYWNKKYLSINEVNYWINWFETLIENENYTDETDCSTSNDCCTCKKFLKLGGESMLKSMKAFIMNYFLIHRIDKKYILTKEIDTWIEWFETMSKKFKDVNDITECYDIENCEDCVKFFKLGGDDLLNYLKEIKVSIFEKFAKNGKLIILEIRNLINWLEETSLKLNGITNPSECVNTEFCEECEKFFNIGGYETLVTLKEFIKKYDLFFVYVNPEFKININLQTNIDDLGEFSIFYEEWKGGIDYSSKNDSYNNGAILQYNDKDWELVEGKGYIYSNQFKENYFGNIDGMTKDELIAYRDNDENNLEGGEKQLIRLIEKKINDDNGNIRFEYNGNVKYNDKISGYTESKLSSFIASTDIICDNLGNKLQGTYINSNKKLKDGDLIGLIYKPNTIVNASNEYDDIGNIINNKYWCNYLKDIILYYLDYNNNILTNKKKLGENGNLIEIIDSLNNELNGKYGKLMCEFTYYMGCEVEIEETDENKTIKILKDGVKYVDTTELVENTCKYFLNDYSYYVLRYYDVIHEQINYKNSSNNFNSYVNKSIFYVNITSFVNEKNEFTCNGWVDFPVIREEYKLGSSSLSNIDVNVNINRGTARAFDQHIKLLEVKSLESLEQYGNGYFNIITN